MTRLLAAVVVPLALLSGLTGGDEKPPPVVRALAFSPDGQALAVGLRDGQKGELVLRDVKSRKVTWRQRQRAGVEAVAWWRDGKKLIAAVGASLVLIDAETGRVTKTLGTHGTRIVSLAQSKDRRIVATAADDGKVRLWDVLKGIEVKALAQPGLLYGVALSPDSRRLVTAHRAGATIWDVRGGEALHALKHNFRSVACAAFSPDGKEVVTAGHDGTVRLWGADTGSHKLTLCEVYGVLGVAIAPRGQALAVWGEGRVNVFSLDRRPGPEAAKRIAALMKRLDDDDYDTREKAEANLVKVGMLAEAALREAATAKSAEVRIRARRARQAILQTPTIDIRPRGARAALSPDGKTIASIGADDVLRMYDAATGKEVLRAREE